MFGFETHMEQCDVHIEKISESLKRGKDGQQPSINVFGGSSDLSQAGSSEKESI